MGNCCNRGNRRNADRIYVNIIEAAANFDLRLLFCLLIYAGRQCRFDKGLPDASKDNVNLTKGLQTLRRTMSIQQSTSRRFEGQCQFNKGLPDASKDNAGSTKGLAEYFLRLFHYFLNYFSGTLFIHNRTQVLPRPQRHVFTVVIFCCGTSDTFRG